MADTEKPRRRRKDGDDESETDSPPKRRRKGSRLSGAKLALRAQRQLQEITGLEPQSVTSLDRGEDGTWTVTVELLELSRVPETDDLLGAYEVELDEDGELLGYRRTRRYTRSQADNVGAQGGS